MPPSWKENGLLDSHRLSSVLYLYSGQYIYTDTRWYTALITAFRGRYRCEFEASLHTKVSQGYTLRFCLKKIQVKYLHYKPVKLNSDAIKQFHTDFKVPYKSQPASRYSLKMSESLIPLSWEARLVDL